MNTPTIQKVDLQLYLITTKEDKKAFIIMIPTFQKYFMEYHTELTSRPATYLEKLAYMTGAGMINKKEESE